MVPSALQSLDPLAQAVERQIKDVWKVFAGKPAHHAGSAVLKARLAEISREIANLRVPYEQWQIVYRQALQLARALDGRGELLEESIFKEETMMTTTPNEAQPENWRDSAADDILRDVPLKELLSRVTDGVKLLASKEAELAKTELQSNLKAGVGTAKTLGIAAVCVLLGLNMLLVAAVLGLATVIEPWTSALIVATALLAIGAAVFGIGWKNRLKNPLEATRASLKEDVQWMTNRLA